MAHTKETTYTIDAAGKTIGRVASEVARALMGKTSPDYTPHIPSQVKVSVTNAKKMRISEKKRLSKVYTHYSGHPGGLKKETLASLIGRRGASAAVRKAVERMLPRNTMKTARLKRLIVTE
ncbi:MAG: 50S ribosomal protein L13 [Patescibacteria group bacterium]